MKLLVDMFACQTASRFRGIGRYTRSMVREMINIRGSNQMVLLANSLYPEAFEDLRREFSRLLPQGSFLPYAHKPIEITKLDQDPFFEISSTIVRHAYQTISPDAIIYPSVFEGWGERGLVPLPNNGVPTALCAAIVYDFIPYRFSANFLDPDPFFKESYLKRLQSYKSFDLLLAISESTRQDAIEILNLDPNKIVNISGAASSVFQKKTYSKDQISSFFKKVKIKKSYIFYPGNGEPHKNLEKLLRAFCKLPPEIRAEHQIVFTHVGDEAVFRSRLPSLGLSDDEVIITGHVTDDDLVMLYNLCHLFVFPSLYEGFGLPILEAMACGAPVIASNSTSIPEVIGRSDAMFDASSERSIIDALYHALTDENFRQDLSAFGLERVKLFSWQKTSQKAWEAIGDALKSKNQKKGHYRNHQNHKPRVAYVSPIPPQKSGIAHFSADLLPSLEKYLDLDLYIEPGLKPSNAQLRTGYQFFPWNELIARKDNYDTVIYQMGNSEFHAHMFQLIKDFPGVVNLHDFFLSHLVRHLISLSHPDFINHDLRSYIDRDHGLRGIIDLVQKGPEEVVWQWPLNWQVLKYAQTIIVHSAYQKELLEYYYGNGWAPKLHIIRQPYPITKENVQENKASSKVSLGIDKDQFLLCSFGLVQSQKLGHNILQAFATAFANIPQALLIFIGDIDKGDYGNELLKLINDLGLNNRVKITGFVDDTTYNQYLHSADVAIQLRTKSRGETSRAVFDSMAHGIPTIVNLHGSLTDYNPNVVVQLPEYPDAESLATAMFKLWADSDLRQKIGSQAKKEIIEKHDPDLIAQQYSSLVIEAIQGDERKLFKPVIDTIIKNHISDEGIKEAAHFAAANHKLHCQPRILIDVTNISYTDLKTGIQRAVKNIVQELILTSNPSINIELVRIENNNLWKSLRFAENLLNLSKNSLGEESPVDILPGDYLYMLDTSWNLFDQYLPIFDQIRRNGGRIFTQLYDLIPIKFPETTDTNTPIVFNQWIKLALDQSDVIICNSQSIADEVIDYISEKNISINHTLDISFVHHGADFQRNSSPDDLLRDHVKQLLVENSAPIFLMVGTIEPRKNHSFALEAFELLWANGEDYRLCIVGKIGWNVTRIMDRIMKHPELGKRLFFVEQATDTELNLCYANSIALISSSIAEGFGLPIIEAAHHGIPSIVSDIPVLHEVGGEGALYFSLDSPANLAKAVKQMACLTPEERQAMVQKIKTISWEESARMILEVLQNKRTYRTLFPGTG